MMHPAKTKPRASSPETKRRGNGVILSNGDKLKAVDKFLAVFRRTANFSAASRAAGVPRKTIYSWLEHNQTFLDAFHQAEKEADDAIRAEIHRRAVTGILKPVFYQGREIARVREYSDILLMFHAKARMPEYRDQSRIEHSGPEGAPISLAVFDRLMADGDTED